MRALLFALIATGVAACGKTLPVAPASESTNVSAPNEPLSPRRGQFPPTPSGIHLNLVFNYLLKDLRKEIGVVDVVWGSRSPLPKQVYNQFYTPFERDGPYAGAAHTLGWWKQHHPDLIEYRCNRKDVAFEFRERNVPIDIANPAALQYQRTSAVDPALKAGYAGTDFDNLELGNYWRRCGHYSASHKWVQQYTGNPVDPAYTRDVLAWAHGTFAYIHRYSPTATMAINFTYDSSFSASSNHDLATQTDEVLDEGGFTNYGSKGHNVTTPQEWRQIVGLIHAVAANKGCYMENGEEPELSKQIPQNQRLWVVSNYLLIRDDCTYMWISGFTASGGQDYGRILLYPEYELNVGKPLSAMKSINGAWERDYSGGLALVNPSIRSVTIPLHDTYVDENGKQHTKSITLKPATGQILLLK